MNVKKILERLKFAPDKSEREYLKRETEEVCSLLKKEISKQKIIAEVFVGGSVAKNTLVKREKYDVDLFVRFDWKYEDLSYELGKIMNGIFKESKNGFETVHGSRDYFRMKRGEIIFEIIPVLRIKNPRESRNVTDLSYFHVNYVKKRLKGKIAEEVILAKAFCKAQGVYGAESYIKGFSGYALECLVIYYGSFEKMLKELSKVKDRIVIDSEKRYKNKQDILFSLNESKLRSPVVMIDPTWKERNVLASLSKETFLRFQSAAKKFLANPSERFFEEYKIDEEKLKKMAKNKKAEILHIKLETDRQPGDIAGTKMKKFFDFLTIEMEKYFVLINKEFLYDENSEAHLYYILKSKKEIIRIGPPIGMKNSVLEFKKKNRNTFVKGGFVHAKIKLNLSAREYIKKFKVENKNKIKEMNITNIAV